MVTAFGWGSGSALAQDELRILSLSRSDGLTTLAWSSQSNTFYDVLWTDSLSPTSIWKLAAFKVAACPGTNVTTWTGPGGGSKCPRRSPLSGISASLPGWT